MSERSKVIWAVVGLAIAVVGADLWLSRLGAWGLVIYCTVLGAVIGWLLVADHLRRPHGAGRPDPGASPHGLEWSP
ncbi:hypothetical protein ABIQ69_14625 [Agromyces sp. G08B096]|uniref:Uncharacterized protein n=1 Tax=Agromyces sp. G08B096 TaxID=3156399 RepID=A0AAU7W5F5_9MICO